MIKKTLWREAIHSKLRRRNNAEHENIKELFQSHNKLLDDNEILRFENTQLNFQVEKLRLEICQQPVSSPTTSAPSNGTVQQLEQKVYKLQEELTELHRRKSENAQQVVDLNNALQDKDKQVLSLQNNIAILESEIMLSKENVTEKDNKIQELDELVQLLRDEYQALNLMYGSIEEKYKTSKEENNELVQRWMLLKAKDAEKLNAENEAMLRKKQLLVEERLKEASLEPRIVCEEDKFAIVSPICISTRLPTKPFLNFDAHEGEVNAIQYNHHGHLIATGGTDRKIRLWDLSHNTVVDRGLLVGSNAAINAIDFDADDSLLLGASNDFASRVWTVQDLRLRHTLTGHSGKVMAAKFLLEACKVVTGSHDRTLKVWDLRSRACIRTLFAGSSCNDIALSESALSTIISGHFDKKVRFWDSRNDQCVYTCTVQGRITSLCTSQDGLTLLCSARDDSLQLIDLRQRTIRQSYTQEGFHLGADSSRAILSPDGAYVACGANEGALFIWNTNSGQLEKCLKEHSSCVMACSWHPSGSTLVSCDRTKHVVAWAPL